MVVNHPAHLCHGQLGSENALASACLAHQTGVGVDDDHESDAGADVDLALIRDIVLIEADGPDDGPHESDLPAGRAQLPVGGRCAQARGAQQHQKGSAGRQDTVHGHSPSRGWRATHLFCRHPGTGRSCHAQSLARGGRTGSHLGARQAGAVAFSRFGDPELEKFDSAGVPAGRVRH